MTAPTFSHTGLQLHGECHFREDRESTFLRAQCVRLCSYASVYVGAHYEFDPYDQIGNYVRSIPIRFKRHPKHALETVPWGSVFQSEYFGVRCVEFETNKWVGL